MASTFAERFRELQTKLGYHPKSELFHMCSGYLNAIWGQKVADLVQQRLPLPWHLLNLLKWGILHGGNVLLLPRPLRPADFQSLYELTAHLSPMGDMLRDGDIASLDRFMRAYFPGQLAYQMRHAPYYMALIATILGELTPVYDTDQALRHLLGLSLQEYMDLLMVICQSAETAKKPRSWTVGYFRPLYGSYPPDKFERFLRHASLDSDTIEEFLRKDSETVGSPEYESSLISPLYRRPFFRIGDEYHAYHATLLDRFMSYGLYELLRAGDTDSFASGFGTGFQNYLERPLGLVRGRLLREGDLARLVRHGRVCDFALTEGDRTVLIEAKTAEMHPLIHHEPTQQHLERTLQNSLVAGYEQFMTFLQNLRAAGSPGLPTANVFAVIVTFKDLGLGGPRLVWSNFMEQAMRSRLPAEISSALPVPPQKVFALSAFDLDHACRYCAVTGTALYDVFAKAEALDRESNTRRWSFHEYFDDPRVSVMDSPHVKLKIDEMHGRLRDALRRLPGQD
ncbi:MAG: hypothetical protein JXA57_18160 [Armatimonadetes bacterium]|nr:hypothetical protein [Armatimonadota bacterium]